jgi:hypothetical protein
MGPEGPAPMIAIWGVGGNMIDLVRCDEVGMDICLLEE